MSLRPDVLVMIFSYLSPSELKQVDLTCHLFFDLTESAYHANYGSQIPHRKCEVQQTSAWKFLALEKEMFLKEMRRNGNILFSPGKVIEEILGDVYLCDDNYISSFSQILILHLHEVPEKGNAAWLTALLVALAAQGRHSEASGIYQELLKVESINYEWIILMMARFELSISADIPMTMLQKTKERALFGAVMGNNLEMIKRLHTDGISLGAAQRYTTVANTAATCGNLSVLRYLHDNGVNLCEAHQYDQRLYADTPLYCAASQGHFDVVRFLLDLGANPDKGNHSRMNHSPFEAALIFGKINILKLFLERTPGLATANSLFIVIQSKMDHRNEVIRYLVGDAKLDVNSKDSTGRTAAHWAALGNDPALVELLHCLKANFAIKDHSGQTPQEVAESHGNREIVIWFARNSWVPHVPMAADKTALALAIVASRHDIHIRRVLQEAGNPSFKKEDVEARWLHEQMGKKLASQYIKMYDADTLRQWNDMLGSEVDHIMLKTLEFESASFSSFTLTEEEEQRLFRTSQLAKEMGLPLPERYAKIMVHFMEQRELEVLTAFAHTDLGRKIFAQQHHDEDLLITSIGIRLGRL